jgi:hypothetical protein
MRSPSCCCCFVCAAWVPQGSCRTAVWRRPPTTVCESVCCGPGVWSCEAPLYFGPPSVHFLIEKCLHWERGRCMSRAVLDGGRLLPRHVHAQHRADHRLRERDCGERARAAVSRGHRGPHFRGHRRVALVPLLLRQRYDGKRHPRGWGCVWVGACMRACAWWSGGGGGGGWGCGAALP